MTRRVLLSGASGFLGRVVVRHLRASGDRVACLRREHTAERGPAAAPEYVYDGTTESVLAAATAFAPDAVLHLAAHYAAVHSPEDLAPLCSANLLYGMQMIEAARASGARRFVAAGTTWQARSAEDPLPVNLYAATKQAFEGIAAYYAQAYGLSTVMLRLCDSYGPGDTRGKLVAVLQRLAACGGRLEMSPGHQKIALLHCEDAAAAIVAALDHAATLPAGQSVTCTAQPTQMPTLRELVALIEMICGRPLDIGWGARDYRPREPMEPCPGTPLPGWSPRIPLPAGLRALRNGGDVHAA